MAFTKTYQGDAPMRVNKWLAQEGVCSRREAEALIGLKLVSIDGRLLTRPGDTIMKGETLTLEEKGQKALDAKLTVIFNKPEGIVSGTPEGTQIPAVRLITSANLSGKAHKIPGSKNSLAPLGRLDMDSRGLLILSEDGVLAKAIIGPDSNLEKEYLVKVIGDITEARLELLRHGLELDGRKLRPAKIDVAGRNELRFILREGRNRQIRRMCDLVGLKVRDLQRTRIGPVTLAGMPEGKWRPMGKADREAVLLGTNRARIPDKKPIAVKRARHAPNTELPPPTPPKPRKPDRLKHPAAKPDPEKFKRTKLGPRKRSPIK